ncbi:MAG: TatD family hydrolase [Succinivibrio sp.]|nr:TatD family hydrolase [Succinivibrio sp.]
MTYFIDTHCHLASLSYQSQGFKSVKEVVDRALSVGVTHLLSVSCTTKEFYKNLELTKGFNNIYLALGIHPLNLEEDPNWSEKELKDLLLSDKRVIALGETGLDYHYSPENKKEQLESFAKQINIAKEVCKPLIIHAREAKDDTLALLRSENAKDVGGVIHCFTDSVDMARQCLDLGFYISFTGVATFKASDNVREVLKYVPNDRLMLETDCPYLAPVPVRGIENEPAYCRYTLKYIADFKGMSEDSLASITSQNFENLYKVKLKEPNVTVGECSTYKLDKFFNVSFEK